MTDALGNILGTIITTPDCSYCKAEPAFVRVDDSSVACSTCWTGIAEKSGISDFSSKLRGVSDARTIGGCT